MLDISKVGQDDPSNGFYRIGEKRTKTAGGMLRLKGCRKKERIHFCRLQATEKPTVYT